MEEERAVAMARRMHRTATRAGLSATEADRLVRLFARVMDRRAATIPEPGHPEYLHPARTALILMDDAGLTDAASLEAAIALDSIRPGLALPDIEIRETVGDAAVTVMQQLPSADLDDAALLEALIVADPALLNVALAERLDHARHLHLSAAAGWNEFHRQVIAVYLPAARRGHPLIERRFGRWAEAFEWRFLRRLV